jgi:aldehyde dehydrogenase (NAD+)
VAGRRLAKVCLELGGKNALVVCDDADLDGAGPLDARVRVLERGPALRAAERIVVFDGVYDAFRGGCS